MLSRNFRLQRVGDIRWLEDNYNFSKISSYIDELIVIDVTRQNRDLVAFSKVLKNIVRNCFVPVAAGGGIRSVDDAYKLLRSGADKIIINTALFSHNNLVVNLNKTFGQQCIVGSIDYKRIDANKYGIFTQNGTVLEDIDMDSFINSNSCEKIGELYINSIDRDGTGNGYEFSILEKINSENFIPIIMAGGAGNSIHLAEALENKKIDAAATAHLFNFIGDGLMKSRNHLTQKGINLAKWDSVSLN